MNNISVFLAFSAGLLSFLSPCVLPLVPAYVGYMTGTAAVNIESKNNKLHTLYKSLGFVLGFSIIFMIMGASATAIGKLFTENQGILRKLGGALMLIFGLHTIGVFKIRLFYYEKRLLPSSYISKRFSSLFMGMAFAAGWTPCVGPILSSILIYAGNLDTVTKGILLLSTYSLGLAVPFILTALAIERFIKYKNRINRYVRAITITSGLLLIVMGIMVFTNTISILNRYLNFNAEPFKSPSQTNISSYAEKPEDKTAKEKLAASIKVKASDFKLIDLNGKEVSLSNFRGKKVYLNFWATWCPPCKAEMPDIEKLYQKTKDSDIVILSINLGEDSKTVKSFMDKNKYTFNVLLDSNQAVATKYNIVSIPTSFFIDEKGIIVSKKIGPMDIDEIKSYINSLN